MNMCDMNHKCDLVIKFVQDEYNADPGHEIPISDIEILDWEQHTEDIDEPTFSPETKGHDTNQGPLNQRTEIGRIDLSQKKNGYTKVASKYLECNIEHQPGNSHSRLSCLKVRFCPRHYKIVFTTVVLFLAILVAVLLAIKLKPHQIGSSQPSVQTLAGDAQIDADVKGKWIPGLCLPEDAWCKEPYCHYSYTDIPVLESLHQIPKFREYPYEKEGCNLVKCNEQVGCLKCNQIKEEVESKTYDCDNTLKCYHALTFMNECFNSTGNHIEGWFCSNDDLHEMPKVQCSPGWHGNNCDQPRNRNITCKCYKSWLNSFCVNYTDCSEMTYIVNNTSLCQKNNLTHCLDESNVCRSQSMEGDQCLCNVKDKEPGEKDL